MDRRAKLAGGVIVLAILVLIVLLFSAFQEPEVVSQNKTAGYTVYDTGQVKANDSYVVSNSGYKEKEGEFQILYGSYGTDLSVYGIYNGDLFFDDVYKEESHTKMSLSNRIKPGDGVLDAFMVPRMKGSKDDPYLEVSVYVDQEFLDAAKGDVVKRWGSDLMNQEEASFSKISEGVYRDTIVENDTRRFLPGVSPSNANIYVGYLGLNLSTGDFSEDAVAVYLD